MSIASIAVHMIVHEAISAHTAHKQEETRRQYEAEGIEYLASFSQNPEHGRQKSSKPD